MMRLKVREKSINAGIVTILALDGWHVFLLETLWNEEWKKGTGERGMPDIMAVRYFNRIILKATAAEVLWVEGKSETGTLAQHQRIWIDAERARGALVWIASEDFPASVEGFKHHYESSGLCRRKLT